MRTLNILTIIFLGNLILSCGSNSGQKQNDFSITTNTKNNAITIGETLNLSIKNIKNHTIEGLVYTLNGNEISDNITLTNF